MTAASLWEEPRATTLAEIVALPGERYPALPAVTFTTDGRSLDVLSWGGMWQGARRTAARLSDGGVRTGDRVVLSAPTSPAFFSAFFGIVAAGGVPVPIAPPTSRQASRVEWYAAHLGAVAQDSGAVAAIAPADPSGLLAECMRVGAPTLLLVEVETGPARLEADAALVGPWPRHHPSPDDLALLQYTSGSTGRPKGVALTHRNILANVAAIADAVATDDASVVSWLPLHHDMGLMGVVLTALYTRRPAVLLPPQAFAREPLAWLRAISTCGATVTVAPNFAFGHTVRALAERDLDGLSLASLRVVLNGAEPVDVASIDAFERALAPAGLRPGIVRAVYGLAESVLAVTFSNEGDRVVEEVDADALEASSAARPAHAGARARQLVSVGHPVATQEVRVVDAHDRPQPERVVGEVVVRGPSVMRGYHNRPDETAAALRGGWLHTGDLGYLSDGRLYLTGRLKDLVIRHGRNYAPADLEAALAAVDGIEPGGVAVFAIGRLWGLPRGRRRRDAAARSRRAGAPGAARARGDARPLDLRARRRLSRCSRRHPAHDERQGAARRVPPPLWRGDTLAVAACSRGHLRNRTAQTKNSSASRSPRYHGRSSFFIRST